MNIPSLFVCHDVWVSMRSRVLSCRCVRAVWFVHFCTSCKCVQVLLRLPPALRRLSSSVVGLFSSKHLFRSCMNSSTVIAVNIVGTSLKSLWWFIRIPVSEEYLVCHSSPARRKDHHWNYQLRETLHHSNIEKSKDKNGMKKKEERALFKNCLKI